MSGTHFDVKIERDKVEVLKGNSERIPVIVTNVSDEAHGTNVRIDAERADSQSWYKLVDKEGQPVAMTELQPNDNFTCYLEVGVPAETEHANDTLQVTAYDVQQSGKVWNSSGSLEVVVKSKVPNPIPWWVWVLIGGGVLLLVAIILTIVLWPETELEPSFNVDVAQGFAPLTVQFTDTSEPTDPAPVKWQWDFGDGTPPVEEQNPTHVFQEAGSYNVQLIVEWPGDGENERSVVSTNMGETPIVVDQPPVVAFTMLPESGRAPLEVQFQDDSAGVSGWKWDFGDGTPVVEEQNPKHTFTNDANQDKTYTVKLTTTDSLGQTHETTRTVTVQRESEIRMAMLKGGKEVTSLQGYAPMTVSFKDKSINMPSRIWDFGDGKTTIEQNPRHRYEAKGNYTVRLQNQQNGEQVTGQVKLYKKPKVTLKASKTRIQRESSVKFTYTFNGDYKSAKLEFGDGSSVPLTRRKASRTTMTHVSLLRQTGTTHKYTRAGKFTAKLVVEGRLGDEFTRSVTITVDPKPGDPRIIVQPIRVSEHLIRPGLRPGG